jgi:hypothetical protein
MSNVPKIYELNGRVIRKIPIKEQWSGGTRFTVGFPVCTLSEYVLDQGEAVVALLNMGEAYQTADGEDRLTVEQAWTILCENAGHHFAGRVSGPCADHDGAAWQLHGPRFSPPLQ